MQTNLIYKNNKLLKFLFEAEEEADTEETVEDEKDTTEDSKNDISDLEISSIDNQLQALIIKAEKEARDLALKSKKIIDSKSLKESKKKLKVSLLYENNNNLIDIDHFANKIARIINNYNSLIDIEQLIIKNTINFLKSNYNEEIAKSFEESLHQMHGFELKKTNEPPESKLGVPNAIGAKTAST
jgi:hypothetical protein